MIGRGEITKAAQADGVDAQTAERDYLLAHTAVHIASVGGDRLVLKGGTCLRLVHYDQYRYSADLDYSLRGIDVAGALELIDDALVRCRESVGLPMLLLDREVNPPRIVYAGPLAAKPRRIKLDLADDELVLEHAQSPLVVTWRDLPEDASICAYTLTEICAEKLRCVIQRRQCRDVFDLWSLLDDRGGAEIIEVWHRFERKAAHRGLDPMRFFDRWHDGVDWYRSRWERELADYLGAGCPDFGVVARSLDRRVAAVREYLS